MGWGPDGGALPNMDVMGSLIPSKFLKLDVQICLFWSILTVSNSLVLANNCVYLGGGESCPIIFHPFFANSTVHGCCWGQAGRVTPINASWPYHWLREFNAITAAL